MKQLSVKALPDDTNREGIERMLASVLEWLAANPCPPPMGKSLAEINVTLGKVDELLAGRTA